MEYLVDQTVPEGYREYVGVLEDSVVYEYKSEHEERFKYLKLNAEELIDRVLRLDESGDFLIQEEREFLEQVRSVFSHVNVSEGVEFETYYQLLTKAFVSLERRTDMIKENLLELMKEESTTETDDMYLFVIQNLQKQLAVLQARLEQSPGDMTKKQRYTLLEQMKTVVQNYEKLIYSITLRDHETVEEVYNSSQGLWEYQKFNPKKKIVA